MSKFKPGDIVFCTDGSWSVKWDKSTNSYINAHPTHPNGRKFKIVAVDLKLPISCVPVGADYPDNHSKYQWNNVIMRDVDTANSEPIFANDISLKKVYDIHRGDKVKLMNEQWELVFTVTDVAGDLATVLIHQSNLAKIR